MVIVIVTISRNSSDLTAPIRGREESTATIPIRIHSLCYNALSIPRLYIQSLGVSSLLTDTVAYTEICNIY